MVLHDLLRQRQLEAAVSWVVEERIGDPGKFGSLFHALQDYRSLSNTQETAANLAAYLLFTGDHLGACLAYAMIYPEAEKSKLIVTSRVVPVPHQCFQFEQLGGIHGQSFFLEPMILERSTWSPEMLAGQKLPMGVAKLERGTILGLSFVPVTEDNCTCYNAFTYNPDNPKHIMNSEDVNTIPLHNSSSIMGCFDGADNYDEGVLIGNHENFAHWLYFHLARLALVESASNLKGVPLVVGENANRTHLECLERMGYAESKLIRLRKGRLARFKRLWTPMMPLCGIRGVFFWFPGIIDFLRTRLGVKASLARRRRLYITRRGARWRRVLNEDEVVKSLGKWGFEVIDPAVMSISQQIDIAAETEAIVGPFGAGMHLLVFAPKGTRVVTLKHQFVFFDWDPVICHEIGQRYVPVSGTPTVAGDNPNHYDFVVPPDHIEQALQAAGLQR
jgi:hypothetical protein